MKKQQLKEAVHLIPGLMKGGARSDTRYKELEDYIDEQFEDTDLTTGVLRWEDIEPHISKELYNMYPNYKNPKGTLLGTHYPQGGLRFEAMNHLQEYFNEKADRGRILVHGDNTYGSTRMPNLTRLNQIIDEYFDLLRYYDLPTPKPSIVRISPLPETIATALKQTYINYFGKPEGEEFKRVMKHCVTRTAPKKGKDRQLVKIRPVQSIVTKEIIAIQVANGYSITETLKNLSGYTLHYIYTTSIKITQKITTSQAWNGPPYCILIQLREWSTI
jgi:hypothetical protein